MAQVSYGTITITDTNDINRIYVEYCRSTSNQLSGSTVPGITVNWSESTPAWVDGQYLWQRAVIEKSGTLEKTYGTPVCITGAQGETGSQGSTGAAGRSLTSTTTQYTTAATNATITQSNMGNYTWSSNVPTYNSSTPAYWVRITNVYSNPSSTEYIIYKDNGITDAVKTSHDANTTASAANTTANSANTTANNANTKADNAVTSVNNLQNKLKYYWVNEVTHTNGVSGWTKPNYPVGTYAASGISGTTFDAENSSTYGYNTWYANGINLRYNAIKLGELTGSALTFYQPSTTNQGAKAMELSGSALKFYASNGTTVQAEFGGSKARVSGTINAYDGQIGNSEDNYWYIGNYLDYFENQSAIIKSHGTASIQLGDSNTWRIATNRIHTAWNNDSSSGDAFKLHFPVYDNKYWDSGLHLPTSANDKLLYIRNSSSSNTLTYLNEALEDQYTNRWNYLFYITNSGSIYAKNIYVLDDNGQATQIGGTDGVYLLKSGGTITGNLTVNGTLTGTLSGTATRVSKDLKIQLNGGTTEGTNQFTYNGSTAKTINITKSSIGLSNVENTALSTWAGSSNLTTTKVGTLAAAAAKGVDTSLTTSTTSTNLPTSAAVVNLIKQYLPLTGGNVTGAVTFGSSVSADELTVGDLVVNGAASFTNNLQANTINGVAVGSSPKFTDTVTTVSVTGSGNAVTSASATNGALTLTKGTTFLTSHQTVTNKAATLAWNSAVTVATIGSTDITVKLPSNPDTNTTYTIGTGDSNGQVKVTPSSGNAYNVSVKGLGSAAFVDTSLFPIVSTYSLPAAKAVRIQYPVHAPVLISAQRSNGGGRLILLGGGYGTEGTVRNTFQELVSSNTTIFTWTLPSSSSISNSIEIMNVPTNGAATIIVWSSAAVTFTEIDALSNDAMNRVIVTSANYTNYTVTKTGSGASGNWGINVTGTAANVTGTVAIANGGTGKTTANDAINALLSGLPVWSANPTDTTYFIRQDTSGTATYGKVPATTLWNYISSKLPSWSQASTKPSYSYSEIGSAPDAIIDATVNEQGVIVLTKNGGGTIPLSTEIAVVESQGANKLVEAGTTTGINVGNAAEPVYFSAGVPVKGNTVPKLNNTTTGGTFYAPTAGGTADTQALVGNGATTAPKWVNISPSISVTAGTSSATPKINVTVLGRSGTAQSLTTASTSVYGATKLSSTSSSTEQGLAATPKLVYDSIAALDGNLNNTTPGAGKTLTAFNQTDGKISATFGDISITKSQISDFPTSMTPAAHTHDDRYYTETEIDTRLKKYVNRVHFGSQNNFTNKYFKISINSYTSWMLNFTVKLYQNYKAYDLQISGYNYGNSYWYSPTAVILGANSTSTLDVSFGYDSSYHLWIAIPGNSYTGIDIIDAVNGYKQLDNLEDLFTIEVIDELPSTVQSTITAYRPWYRNETVTNATNATQFSAEQSITLTGDTTGSASSKKGWSITTVTNALSAVPATTLNSQEAIDNFLTANKFQFGLFKTTDTNNVEMASNDGMILSLPWSSTSYGAQIALDDATSGVMKFRGKATNWGDWHTVIHDGNYTTYTVTKTGTGASGTWGISISGNATTASKLGLSTVGGTGTPIYLDSGTPKAITTAIPSSLGGTGQTSLINAANSLLNALSTGSSTPVDNDYYISQYVSGGTTTTTYHRRPMSALWSYISGKISSSGTYVTIATDQTITASQKTFNGATRWSITNSTTGSKYGACNYDATLDALVFSFGTI